MSGKYHLSNSAYRNQSGMQPRKAVVKAPKHIRRLKERNHLNCKSKFLPALSIILKSGILTPGSVRVMNLVQCFHRISSGTVILEKVKVALVTAAIFLVVPLLWAHHGMAAFDTTHTVRMEGTVTSFEFINPHSFIYADMKDEMGKVTNWKLELGSLGMLTRYGGWSKSTVKRGDLVKVQGYKAKDGSAYFSVGLIKLPNGKTLEGKP